MSHTAFLPNRDRAKPSLGEGASRPGSVFVPLPVGSGHGDLATGSPDLQNPLESKLDSGTMEDPFVPADFEVPLSHAWSGFHLEPLGAHHNERDHAAWMSSIDHIRATPGFTPEEERNWPVAMSLDDNLADLVRHARDFAERKGFTYSILEGNEVIGCIYIYPDRRSDHDAAVSSWVRESRAEVDGEVREALATWIDEVWPFTNPSYAGREKVPQPPDDGI